MNIKILDLLKRKTYCPCNFRYVSKQLNARNGSVTMDQSHNISIFCKDNS